MSAVKLSQALHETMALAQTCLLQAHYLNRVDKPDKTLVNDLRVKGEDLFEMSCNGVLLLCIYPAANS